jgi:hypothetical protein
MRSARFYLLDFVCRHRRRAAPSSTDKYIGLDRNFAAGSPEISLLGFLFVCTVAALTVEGDQNDSHHTRVAGKHKRVWWGRKNTIRSTLVSIYDRRRALTVKTVS